MTNFTEGPLRGRSMCRWRRVAELFGDVDMQRLHQTKIEAMYQDWGCFFRELKIHLLGNSKQRLVIIRLVERDFLAIL